MSIVVTGATGHLGRHVVEQLLEKVPADQITAVVRDAEKAADFAARGVKIAVADYNAPETFDSLLSAGDKVLLISGNEFDKGRVGQHKVVIDAAKAAGVALLAYTSAPGTLTAALADDHRATEEALLASGVPYALLRNGWYHENYTENLAPALEHGAVVQAAGEGRVSSASRADYAAAAVAVLTGEGHENKTYELGGDEAWSFAEYAAELSRQTGKEIAYSPVSVETFIGILTGAGLPEPFAAILAGVDASIEKGELVVSSGDLSRLAGRPTTPIADVDRGRAQGLTAPRPPGAPPPPPVMTVWRYGHDRRGRSALPSVQACGRERGGARDREAEGRAAHRTAERLRGIRDVGPRPPLLAAAEARRSGRDPRPPDGVVPRLRGRRARRRYGAGPGPASCCGSRAGWRSSRSPRRSSPSTGASTSGP